MKANAAIKAVVKELLETQKFGVLATRTGESPHLNLVALAAAPDMSRIFFATARATSKYANLRADGRAAVLVDNRSNRDADLEKAAALNVIGEAREVGDDERESLLGLFLGKHPSLTDFARSPETAFFEIKVGKFILVREFGRVDAFEP